MFTKLKERIKEEDPKNPLKDEALAKLLDVSREKVNFMRQQVHIPSYLKRREKILLDTMYQIMKKDPNLSLRKMTLNLNEKGFKISTFGLKKYYHSLKDSYVVKDDKRMLQDRDEYEDAFSKMIGAKGSLRQVIQLAKASVLYPPNGLHTLLFGHTGVGKSQLVDEIHEFYKRVRKDCHVPLVTLNCADYSDNPQLLVAQLFGYCKGSFTGADKSKAGLVEKAHRGILFLDEIHRLPSKGQEILFRIIDKGEFSRLGETDHTRKVQVMIIGATTENLESNLLMTFRRRIPMMIELPSLDERPIKEKLELIYQFFSIEATKLKQDIYLSRNILNILLFYQCSGNIGQLKSDIQVICAKAFLSFLSKRQKQILITLKELPHSIKNQVLDLSNQRQKKDYIGLKDRVIHPNSHKKALAVEKQFIKDDLYAFIEKRMEDIHKDSKGLKEKKTKMKELSHKVEDYALIIEKKYGDLSKKDIENFVGPSITKVIQESIENMKIDERFKNSLFHILCFHVCSAIERLKVGKKIIHPRLNEIKSQYPKAFCKAKQMVYTWRDTLDMDIPEDEAGFIALYLIHYMKKNQHIQEAKVKVVIITHGQVAKAMLKVTQSLLGIHEGIAVSMDLIEKPQQILEKVRKIVQREDEGKGVLLLVDMGSLVAFGEILSEQLGIKIQTIPRVDTLMVIEAIRKASIPSNTMDSVYDSIVKMDQTLFYEKHEKVCKNHKKRVIVTTCVTGEGTARKIREMLQNILREQHEDIEIVSIGLVNEDYEMKIEKIQREKEVLLMVGTIDPGCEHVLFIPFEEILSGQKMDLLMDTIKRSQPVCSEHICMNHLFKEECVKIFTSPISKENFIKEMVDLLYEKEYVHKDFYEDILEREEYGTSYIGEGVSIPHAASTIHIKKPVIAIGVSSCGISWEDQVVNVVLVLALGSEHKREFLNIYHVIKQTDLIQVIKGLKDKKTIIKEVLDYANSNQGSIHF